MTPVEVLDKVKQIAKKHGCSSMVNELLADLKERRAFLFKNTDSFIAMQPNTKQGYCWVWVAYSADAKAYEQYIGILLELAEQLCGKPVMRFMSPRKGYARSYKKRGWKQVSVVNGATVWELK